MSFRPGFRAFNAFRANFTQYTRRNASTATGAEPAGFQKFWNSPIGPKTVHFWYAPLLSHKISHAGNGSLGAMQCCALSPAAVGAPHTSTHTLHFNTRY